MPSLSPDSRWIAYQSDETGKNEVYVRPFPGPGGRVQISTGGGIEPRWPGDGAHVVYRDSRTFWSAAISVNGGSPAVTDRDSLFADTYERNDAFHQTYDIARDGRFAILRNASGNAEVIVVANWLNEAREKRRRR